LKEYPLEYNGIKVDPIIFTQGFVPACNMKICHGQCCDWGVYMDKDFKDIILKFEEEIKDAMDEHQIKDSGKWFEKETEVDPDFPSGEAIGTEVYKTPRNHTQCVFKDGHGYCSIQVAAVKNNMHKWAIKPKYCIMYPLTILDNVLTYDDDHAAKLDYCGIDKKKNFTQTIFEAMTEELRFIMGEDGYNYINDYYQKHYKNVTKFE
jgi:hypothetical protein